MSGGRFQGAWRVREYVFAPSGEPLGIVDQSRRLEGGAEGRIRVLQDCEPEARLSGHPMSRFAGHHAFELSVDGRTRRYHGPAVIGTGVSFGDGAMWGRGLWPVFEHNFTSFAILVAPGRQLTGGKFLRASEMVANIVGVAVSDTDAGAAPRLSGPTWPGDVARTWTGTLRRFKPDGAEDIEHAGGDGAGATALRREYGPGQSFREEGGDGVELALRALPGGASAASVAGRAGGRTIAGLAKTYGWMLEAELVAGPERVVEWMEVLDAEGGHLVGFRRTYTDHVLARVEVMRLSPDEEK